MDALTMAEPTIHISYLTKEIVNNVYGSGAKMYDKVMAEGWRSLIDRPKVIDSLSLSYDDRVLEIGVGTGLNLEYYPQDIDLTAIDFTPQMLNEAVEKKNSVQPNFHLMDAENMSFQDDYFDAILTTLVVSAAPNPMKLLAEANRVVKPNGKISILDVCKSPLIEVSNVQEQLILPYSTTSGFPAPNKDIPNGVIVYQPNRDIVKMAEETGWNVLHYEILNPENPFTCRIYLLAEKKN